MNVCAVIPVKRLTNSKNRLAGVLNLDQRVKLSAIMLRDVLESVCRSRMSRVIVVSSDEEALGIAREFGADILREGRERGVNMALALADDICSRSDASIVIPHDLPLIKPEDLEMLLLSAREGKCVVITPAHRYDGTNVLLRKPHGVMETHYDEDSYLIHLQKAGEKGLRTKVVLGRRLMLDIDEPRDIIKVLSSNYTCGTVDYLRSIVKGLRL